MKHYKKLKFAAVQYLEPPHPARSEEWKCHRLRSIEKGVYQGSEVSIYTVGNMERRCIEFPEANLDQVTSLRTVLDVLVGHFY